MTTSRILDPSIAAQWLRILSDYAYLSDDSDFSRRISQIAPEEISISSEERKNSSEESTETSEESNHKSEEFRHFLGRKTKISPEIFENSSGEIEMSSLSLYYNASALMATQPLVDKKTTTRIAPRGRQMSSFAS